MARVNLTDHIDQTIANRVPAAVREELVDAAVMESGGVKRIIAAEIGTTPVLDDGDLVVYYQLPGSLYYTDFGEALVGQAPAGWSQPWQVQPWQVQEVADATRGKALTVDPTPGNGLSALLAWDQVGADPYRGDVELLYKTRTTGTSTVLVSSAVRGFGAEGSESGYRIGSVSPTSASVHRYEEGDVFTNVSVPIPGGAVVPDEWYMVRARMEGETQKVKVWKSGEQEPMEWLVHYQNRVHEEPGFVGLLAQGMPNVQHVDWVAVATGGRTAVAW